MMATKTPARSTGTPHLDDKKEFSSIADTYTSGDDVGVTSTIDKLTVAETAVAVTFWKVPISIAKRLLSKRLSN